jgi:cytochrome P450
LSGILGLLRNPEALKKAQMELDTVVGHSRLPDFSDYDSLPYIKAVAQETMRWRTAGPIGEFISLTKWLPTYRLRSHPSSSDK